MGYDLHITRADQWHENQGHEIPATEWLDLIERDLELSHDPKSGKYSVTWKAEGNTGWFDWYDGNVFTTDPSPATVRKLLDMARSLHAKVQGDDGEVYRDTADWSPIER